MMPDLKDTIRFLESLCYPPDDAPPGVQANVTMKITRYAPTGEPLDLTAEIVLRSMSRPGV